MTDMGAAFEDITSEVLPFESWERLAGEGSAAFAAFCAFRGVGPERNIRKAVDSALKSNEMDEGKRGKRCRVWRNWSAQFRWKERAAAYDNYVEKLKQEEHRKTIEAQGEYHRAMTGKMLRAAEKKIDAMNPHDLTPDQVSDWVFKAIKAEREAAGLVAPNGKPEAKQSEFVFDPDFKGL